MPVTRKSETVFSYFLQLNFAQCMIFNSPRCTVCPKYLEVSHRIIKQKTEFKTEIKCCGLQSGVPVYFLGHGLPFPVSHVIK
jgi:hypothetical protein